MVGDGGGGGALPEPREVVDAGALTTDLMEKLDLAAVVVDGGSEGSVDATRAR